MKQLVLLLLAAAGIASWSFQSEETVHTLYPGKGMDKNVRIGTTSRSQIVDLFGVEFREINHYDVNEHEDHTMDTAISFIEQRYDKLGISFCYRYDSIVTGIQVRKPCHAVTDKGVLLGKALMADADALYGTSEWTYTDRLMLKEHDGIAFMTSFDGKFPITEGTQNAGLKKKISEIDIYNGIIDLYR